ncbi:MAG: RNA-guided pseudouridylation complex pseudouridine synthase subunit Cbf5 [Candidatus Hydrothermarchaeales archaeon]
MTQPLYKRVSGKLIVKNKATSSGNFGKYPEARTVEEHIKYGVINLDKPRGPTSHEVVSWIKDILGVRKAGHSGTLDPRVTGVLPVALVAATKTISTIFHLGKEYVCVMRLHEALESEKVIKTIRKFQGEIYQRPPVKSAVKRQLRTRKIYYINILEMKENRVLMTIGCEAGTYIRKLCHDMGLLLGCGAHMEELRRTKAGPFEEEGAVTLHDVKDAYQFWKESGIEGPIRDVIRPVETVMEHLLKAVIRDSAVDALCHGADLAIPGISRISPGIKKDDRVAILTLKNELVALGDALMNTEEILTEDAGIAVKTKRVVMETGTYPPMWKSHDQAVPG